MRSTTEPSWWCVAASAALATLAGVAHAEPRLPKIFSDHMVLQRDRAVPVWGWADSGETVTVTIAGQSLAVTADAAGRWNVSLAPLGVNGTGLDLRVAGQATNVVVGDILVGDVWLCSGQSNMEVGLSVADNAQEVIPAATNAMIRLLSIKSPQAPQAVTDIPNGWTVCDPQTVGAFSAVGYFFGRTIQRETGIPIGLIANPWSGSSIEPWLPAAALATTPELAKASQEFGKRVADFDRDLAKLIDPVEAWVGQARRAQAAGSPLPIPPSFPTHPAVGGYSGIYNGRVAPLIPFAIKGVIWYQGESNGTDGEVYVAKMRALIGSWRAAWNQGEFPFYFVQLANHQDPSTSPAGGDGWARLRQAQLQSLQIPRTGMASAIDIGSAREIHPRNKQDVGDRLALWALRDEYGRKGLVCSGPLYRGMTVDGSQIRVSFNYAENGVMVGHKTGHGPAVEAQGGTLARFAIAGEDRTWFWADAVVDGSTVLVSSPKVPSPVAVRYAFSMNPEGCNLYNREGLPASPFRTDAW